MGNKESTPPIELQIMAGDSKARMVHHQLNFKIPRKAITIGNVQDAVVQVLAQNNLTEQFAGGYLLYADGRLFTDRDALATASHYILLMKTPANAGAGDNIVATISLTGKATLLTVDPSVDTVLDLKQKLQDKEGIPPDQVLFLFNGRILKQSEVLKDAGVVGGCTLQHVLRLRSTDGEADDT